MGARTGGRKGLALALVLALTLGVFTLAACGGSGSGSGTGAGAGAGAGAAAGGGGTLRAAAIFGGAINDGNWNETQYNGLKNLESLGYEIKYMENQGDTDAAQAARDYANEGFDLVYLTTNSYQDHCTPVAERFPDTMFVQINGTYLADNFISVRIADEQQGFLQGAIAALLTKSGNVGFVGGQEINPIKLGSAGFQQGVDYINKTYGLSVTAHRINTGNFTDVNQAKETAISLIEAGCDVVTPMANDASVGVMEAAEEKGAMAIGCGLGQEAAAPTTTQVIVVKDVAVAYDATGALFAEGELKRPDAVETFGANYDVVYITDWFTAADAEVEARVNETLERLRAGEIEISAAL
jgi:basic membrane protein A